MCHHLDSVLLVQIKWRSSSVPMLDGIQIREIFISPGRSPMALGVKSMASGLKGRFLKSRVHCQDTRLVAICASKMDTIPIR